MVLFQIWESDGESSLRASLQLGATVRVTKCKVMAHNAKTAHWTTSRLPVFLRAVPETQCEAIPNDETWPTVHPLTGVHLLCCLL